MNSLFALLILVIIVLCAAAIPAAISFLTVALTKRDNLRLASPLPAVFTRRQLIVVTAVALAFYASATYVGYVTFRTSPEGLLLYTPPPNAPPIYTPSFQIGFALVLLGGAAASLLLSLAALLVQLLSPFASTTRGAAHQSLKGLLLLSAVCGIGAIVIGAI